MNFQALIDPSTTLGAFLISLVAGIFGGAILGFITGKNYQKRKTNKVKADTIESAVYQGNATTNTEQKKSEKTKNTINAGTVKGPIVQDSPGVILDGGQKSGKGKAN